MYTKDNGIAIAHLLCSLFRGASQSTGLSIPKRYHSELEDKAKSTDNKLFFFFWLIIRVGSTFENDGLNSWKSSVGKANIIENSILLTCHSTKKLKIWLQIMKRWRWCLIVHGSWFFVRKKDCLFVLFCLSLLN